MSDAKPYTLEAFEAEYPSVTKARLRATVSALAAAQADNVALSKRVEALAAMLSELEANTSEEDPFMRDLCVKARALLSTP